MSNRSEEAALRLYPESSGPMERSIFEDRRVTLACRRACEEGYEQAEKDVWGRIKKYLSNRNPTDYATVGWILKNIEEYKKEIMEEEL